MEDKNIDSIESCCRNLDLEGLKRLIDNKDMASHDKISCEVCLLSLFDFINESPKHVPFTSYEEQFHKFKLILEYMLSKGLDINYKNGFALKYAALHTYSVEIVKLLLTLGANPGIVDNFHTFDDLYIHGTITRALEHELSNAELDDASKVAIREIQTLLDSEGPNGYEKELKPKEKHHYSVISNVFAD